MKKTKLQLLIETLNGHEIKMADKFLHSVYFNEHEIQIAFFHVLVSKKGSDKKDIWKKLFGKKKYNDLRFRRMSSDLLKLMEEFLAIRHFQKDGVALQLNWIKTVNERKLTGLFNYSHLVATKKQEKNNYLSAEYFLHQYQLEEQLYYHFENLDKRTPEKNLFETIHHLDQFYIISKLQYACLILHYSNMLKHEKEIPLLPELIQYLAATGTEHNPIIQNYFLVFQMMQHPAEEMHFKKLKEALIIHEKEIPRNVLRELYLYAINHGVRRINYGELHYLKEVFDLYKSMLKNKLLFNGKILSQWDYKNLVVTACRLGEYKWAERFIEQYKIFLPATERANAVRYNLAKLAFYKNDYGRVLKLLQMVEYTDPFYILDSKSMLLKSFYELDEDDSLNSLCNSFSILLKRKKLISESHRVNHLNFIRFIRRLLKADTYDQKKIRQLNEEIEIAKQVADKGWLMEKLKELVAD